MTTISALTKDGRHLDPRFSNILLGPIHGVMTVAINRMLDIFMEEYPKHWTLKDWCNEPDWKDWIDFYKSSFNGDVRNE